MLKKIILIASTLVLVTCLVACGDNGGDKWSYDKEQNQNDIVADTIIPEGYKVADYKTFSKGFEELKALTSSKGVDVKKVEEMLGAEAIAIPASSVDGNKVYLFWGKGKTEDSSLVSIMVSFKPVGDTDKYEYFLWSGGYF